MTDLSRSTARREMTPQLAALALCALRLRLQRDGYRPRKVTVDKQMKLPDEKASI